jgi:hypothetical protein
MCRLDTKTAGHRQQPCLHITPGSAGGGGGGVEGGDPDAAVLFSPLITRIGLRGGSFRLPERVLPKQLLSARKYSIRLTCTVRSKISGTIWRCYSDWVHLRGGLKKVYVCLFNSSIDGWIVNG